MGDNLEVILQAYRDNEYDIRHFKEGVERYFLGNPKLFAGGRYLIHSSKSRMKDIDHLKEKIIRKTSAGREVSSTNLFDAITDLAGVRVLLLFQDDFARVNEVILNKVNVEKDWILAEAPKAYTWDPENTAFFNKIGIESHIKESFYTSVHYLVKPRADSNITCEIQVRTLFEEIWGEVDHHLNYPTPTENMALKEQIKVLSKIVGAGSRLLDSIRRVEGG